MPDVFWGALAFGVHRCELRDSAWWGKSPATFSCTCQIANTELEFTMRLGRTGGFQEFDSRLICFRHRAGLYDMPGTPGED